MSKYIFTEDEWLHWESKYTDAALVGLKGERYGQIKHAALLKRTPGIETMETWVGVNVFGPGGVYESHAHESTQFIFILAGKARIRVGDEERVVEKGAWIFTPAGVPHYTENIGDTDLAYLLIGGNPKDKNSKAHTAITRVPHKGK